MPYTPPSVTLHAAAGPRCFLGLLDTDTAIMKQIRARQSESLSINIDKTPQLPKHNEIQQKQHSRYRPPCSLLPVLRTPRCPPASPASPTSRSSTPNTPRTPKMVHFDSNVQMCPFFKIESPICISTESTCTDDGQLDQGLWSDLDSYPSTDAESDSEDSTWAVDPTYNREPANIDGKGFVQLCGLRLSNDNKMICGSIAVAAATGTQSAACRFTFDNWSTVSEVLALPNRHAKQWSGYDWLKFEVDISGLAHLERRSCILCVHCNIDGQEYWDNNAGSNFQVHFIRQHRDRHQKRCQKHHHRTRQQYAVRAATERSFCPLTTAKPPGPAMDNFKISCASYEDILDKYCFVCTT